jgi:hypothetical protein
MLFRSQNLSIISKTLNGLDGNSSDENSWTKRTGLFIKKIFLILYLSILKLQFFYFLS